MKRNPGNMPMRATGGGRMTQSSRRTLADKAGEGGIVQLTEAQKAALAQRRAYEFYRRRDGMPKSSRQSATANNETIDDRNAKIASYMAAVVVGALGATYAAVPLYKIFCQATGFGGTTQRVNLSDWAESQEQRESSGRTKVSQALWDKLIGLSNVPSEMLPGSPGASHGRGGKTWTDEEAAEKLASLRPRKDGQLITVRFDSTVGDVLPWSFVPAQLDVKVVPGETALSFFTATNHSDKAVSKFVMTVVSIQFTYFRVDHGRGHLQRPSAQGRLVFQQDTVLLLRGAEVAAGRDGRHARFLFHRPRDYGRSPDEECAQRHA